MLFDTGNRMLKSTIEEIEATFKIFNSFDDETKGEILGGGRKCYLMQSLKNLL